MSLRSRDVTNEESTERAMRPAYQSQADGEHVWTQSLVCWLADRNRRIVCFAGLAARTTEAVKTPWRGILFQTGSESDARLGYPHLECAEWGDVLFACWEDGGAPCSAVLVALIVVA